jgi:RimJ/RimL family protein N-acetyltransferase
MPLVIPGPAYRVITKRLIIRCYNPTDAPLVKAAVDESRDHLRVFLGWAARQPEELQERIDLLRRWRGKFDLGEDFFYGIFNADETRLLGGIGLHTTLEKDAREIGYWIHKDFINQGYATEASAALTKVAFEIDQVRRVEIHNAIENVRSAAVPRKLGFTLEATLRQRELLEDGRYHDQMIWTLLSDEYPNSPCAQAPIEAYDAAGRQII